MTGGARGSGTGRVGGRLPVAAMLCGAGRRCCSRVSGRGRRRQLPPTEMGDLAALCAEGEGGASPSLPKAGRRDRLGDRQRSDASSSAARKPELSGGTGLRSRTLAKQSACITAPSTKGVLLLSNVSLLQKTKNKKRSFSAREDPGALLPLRADAPFATTPPRERRHREESQKPRHGWKRPGARLGTRHPRPLARISLHGHPQPASEEADLGLSARHPSS